MQRQGRTVRRAGVKVRLTERDEVLLAALARFGVARSSDLRTFLYAGRHRDVFASRMRRLFDGGFVDVTSAGFSEANVYTLGPQGKAWAIAHGVAVTRPPRGGRQHWLAIVETWVRFARFAHETPGWELLSARPEWQIRPEALGCPVIPDLTLKLSAPTANGAASVHLAVEVDLATERASVLSRKVAAYREVLAVEEGLFGWQDFGVGFAVSGWSPSRREAFSRKLEEHLPTWWLLWDIAEGPEQALNRIVESIGGPVTASRYGNGSQPLVSADATERSADGSWGLSHEERHHVVDEPA
jgi:hypothetical protein